MNTGLSLSPASVTRVLVNSLCQIQNFINRADPTKGEIKRRLIHGANKIEAEMENASFTPRCLSVSVHLIKAFDVSSIVRPMLMWTEVRRIT